MKIGFIGFGKSVNRYHAPFISQIKDAKVEGYYSKGEHQFEMIYPKFNELKRYETLSEMLNDELDLIIVSTPAKYHFQYAKDVIKANKHVLIEKPMCSTVQEAKELYALAKKHNVICSPYQNRRFDSDFLDIKQAINTCDVGKILEIESNHTQYRIDGLNRVGSKYDGFIYGHAVHFIDQIVSMYGEPDDLIYDFTNQKDYYLEGTGQLEDYYNIILIYGNMRVRVRYSQLIVKEPPRWIVNGLNATIEKYKIDNQERDLKCGIYPSSSSFAKDNADEICNIYYRDGTKKQVKQKEQKLYTEFYYQLFNYIKTGENPPVPECEALYVLNILETIVNHRKYKKLADSNND